MRTYWQNFLNEYKREIPYVSIAKTLEAFWHYSNNSPAIASELMVNEEIKPNKMNEKERLESYIIKCKNDRSMLRDKKHKIKITINRLTREINESQKIINSMKK